nr:retrovirus-related Pol polyprotein from transposon TNT 1-94 [Tanacetum cinerariifolium]
MSGTIPPIPPHFEASSRNTGSPNVNRVDTMPTTTDPINTTITKNMSQSVVDENFPQLLDSGGGSHVTNVPTFNKEDFMSSKVRFLVFLDRLEPYLLKTLEDGPFVTMPSFSTSKNTLPKRQNQWSNAESRIANQDKRLKSIIISCLPNDVMKSVIKCKTKKEMWNDLILAHEGPYDTRDTNIAALRLKFNAFKSLEGEKVNVTFTRLKCLLNDLENNGVTIPQVEFNATFVNSQPRKWLSMNQSQRANNSIKNDSLATMYGKYNYEEGLIDQIYESDSDSNVEEDQRTSNEFMADLNAEYHERALLTNQKRFYKRPGRVGSSKKPLDKTKKTCFACGKLGHFQKDYDKGSTKIRSFIAIAEDEPSVGKADARSGQWVDITMKKVHKLLSMTDGDEKKHVLDYTHVDLHYVEDQRKNLVIPGNIVKALGEKGRKKEKISSKEVVFTKTNESSSVLAPEITSDSESECDTQEPLPPLPKLIGAAPSAFQKVLFFSDLNLNMADLTLDTPDPKKTRPSVKVSSAYVINKKTEKSSAGHKPCFDKKANSSTEKLLLTLMEEVKGLKRQIEIPLGTPPSSSKPSNSKASKQKTWFRPYKHCGFRNYLFNDCYSKPKCYTCGSTKHLTKEHLEHDAVQKTLSKLKVQLLLRPSPKKASMIPKPFIECKYYGFNDHHSDHCEFYRGCKDYLKKSVWYLDSGCFTDMTKIKQYLHRYSKESGRKVVFGDDSARDTEGYGLVNFNGITFTRVAYVYGLKHNLISISQLCDANYKVLFTKTQGTIYNQNYEVVLIAPRKRDIYVIDMSSFNKESNACFFANASPSVNWLWHKRLSQLNFKNINNLVKHKLVSGLPSLTFSKDKNCSSCEKGKHHKESFKLRDHFPSTSPYISFTWICLDLSNPKPSATTNIPLKMENLNEVRIKELRRDNGTEFRNHKLEEFCDEKGDAINFNENRSFPDDEFLEPRSEVTQCPGNTKYFPYILAYENTTPFESPILQLSVILKDPFEFTEADNHPALTEPDQTELADLFEPTEPQNNVIIKPINNVQPSTTISPSAEVILQTPVPQYRWSREKHIELVNIIGEPLAGITTRGRIKDSDPALASECLYVNFLSEMKPKKLIKALKEEGWIIAMQEELNQFERNKFWTLVLKPHGKTTIETKWICKNKMDKNEIVIKNKARLVAQGYNQQEGLEYEETFAPVARLEAIRIFLAYAAYMGFIVYHMDVKSELLNGKISKEVYVQQPLGFESSEYPIQVCKVDKALYGLKQAPRAWYETLSKFLIQHKFVRGTIDNTLFTYKTKSDVIIVQIYMDDIIFGSTSSKLSKQFGKLMTKKYEMSMMGELTYFMGFQIKQDFKGIFICQEKYVKDLLKKYDLADCAIVKCPMLSPNNLGPDESGVFVNETLFIGMIGSLMYLTTSIPNIQFSICLCARYLKRTPNLGLWYPKGSGFDLKACFDSDYTGCNLDRKSTSGGCQILG